MTKIEKRKFTKGEKKKRTKITTNKQRKGRKKGGTREVGKRMKRQGVGVKLTLIHW